VQVDPAEAAAGRKFKANVFRDQAPKSKSRSGKGKKATTSETPSDNPLL